MARALMVAIRRYRCARKQRESRTMPTDPMTEKAAASRPVSFLLILLAVSSVAAFAQSPAPKGGTKQSTPTLVQQGSPTPTPPLAAVASPAPNQVSQTGVPPASQVDWTPALATLIAGALGFLAALLVEKRSWQRRKLEQVREAQLAKITSVARQLHSFTSILAKVEKQAISPATASQSLSAEPGLRQAQARVAILASIPSMDATLDEVEMMSIELMTLRAKKEVLTDLEAYLSRARGVVSQIRSAAQGRDAANLCQAVGAISRDTDLGDAFRTFVAHALDGLNE